MDMYEEANQERVNTKDIISELPEPIIHHILSFLPTKDATQTTILSKRWRHILYSSPIIDLDESYFGVDWRYSHHTYEQKREDLANHADDLLKRRNQNFNVGKFRLRMQFTEELASRMDSWISFALKHNVKDLDIHSHSCWKETGPGSGKFINYVLPKTIFEAKSLTVLKLERCDLKHYFSFSLPSLKTLSLKGFPFNDKILHDFILGCPLVEDLSVNFCNGLKNIEISSLKVKFLELKFCLNLERVLIKALNLQSFGYHGVTSTYELEISAGYTLTNLWLEDAYYMTQEKFEDVIYRFPLLENLVLDNCKLLKCIKISCQRLKSLVLIKCIHVVEIEIDTPNLHTFTYSGNMISFSSKKTLYLQEAKIYLYALTIDTQWYHKLRHLLQSFDHSKVLTLGCSSYKTLIVPKESRDSRFPPLYNLKHLKVELISGLMIDKGPMIDKILVDGLLWLFPVLKTLLVDISFPEKCFEFQFDNVVARKKGRHYSKSSASNSWRYYFQKLQWRTSKRQMRRSIQ